MESLNLPKFNIPEMKQKRLTSAAFHRTLVQNVKLLADSGQLARILRKPCRHPVNARFVLR